MLIAVLQNGEIRPLEPLPESTAVDSQIRIGKPRVAGALVSAGQN